MNVIQHPSSKRARPEDECEYLTALRRDIVAAAMIAAVLLAGVAVGASLGARQESPLMQPGQVLVAEPADFDYFPSTFVNQGVASTDELPTF